ncbi:DUF4189 domain-containing protein [Lysobacter humi (ex Lee et al. 2017)]
MRELWLAVGLLVTCGQAFAQQCPTGLAGQPNCLPPDHPSSPYRRSVQPLRPSAQWESRYAAVAMGKAASGFTAVGPLASQRKAEKDAVRGCRARGGDDCKLVFSFGNQCGVIVWGRTVRTLATAATVAEAAEKARRECSADTQDCEVFFADCVEPVRVR